MSSWGPGILESDAAMDIQDELSQLLGCSVQGCSLGEVRQRRAAIQASLPALLGHVRQTCPVEDTAGALSVVQSVLTHQPRLSAQARGAMDSVAARLAAGDALTQGEAELVPSYFRAVGCQVLATVLMRFGCAVPADVHQTLLDGLLNCEELAVALDENHEYVQPEADLPAEMARQQRVQAQGRLRTVHALHRQFSAYDIQTGRVQDLVVC